MHIATLMKENYSINTSKDTGNGEHKPAYSNATVYRADGSTWQSLFLYDVQVRWINRRKFTLLREQATVLDNLLLWDLTDLEPVLIGQLPVEDLQVLLEPLLVVALDDGRHSLLIYPSQRHLTEEKNGCVSVYVTKVSIKRGLSRLGCTYAQRESKTEITDI